MPYEIAGQVFASKDELTKRCREIRDSTPDGRAVPDDAILFLFDLFRHHDEWPEKSASGVRRITTQTTEHGTKCFMLERVDGERHDISFPHSIRLIRGSKTRELLPQGLLDYRNAARTAVRRDIRRFREERLTANSICPITNEVISRESCHVDHVAPRTFDRLLLDFTAACNLNPITVDVGSRNGTVAYFVDKQLESRWIDFHSTNSLLRLLTKTGHAQIAKAIVDWSPLLSH